MKGAKHTPSCQSFGETLELDRFFCGVDKKLKKKKDGQVSKSVR